MRTSEIAAKPKLMPGGCFRLNAEVQQWQLCGCSPCELWASQDAREIQTSRRKWQRRGQSIGLIRHRLHREKMH